MKILITGIAGMTGSHLADFLCTRKGVDLHGVTRWQESQRHLGNIMDRLTLHKCDLRDAHGVDLLIEKIRPQRIYHLAAETSVANSWNNPDQTLTNNVTCQLNILEAIRHISPSTKLLVTGSSESYGLVTEEDLPVTEDTGFHPLSPYGVSKVSQDMLAYQYHKSYNLNIIRLRVFNLTGPRQNPTFALASFARQLARIDAGLSEPVIRVGNLSAQRDFTDFRDAARAYWMALEHGIAGEVYNIGTGQARPLQKALDTLIKISGLSVTVENDPERMRPSDIPSMVCDNNKFTTATGWQPSIAFTKTLEDLYHYWQHQVKEAS